MLISRVGLISTPVAKEIRPCPCRGWGCSALAAGSGRDAAPGLKLQQQEPKGLSQTEVLGTVEPSGAALLSCTACTSFKPTWFIQWCFNRIPGELILQLSVSHRVFGRDSPAIAFLGLFVGR